MIWRRVLTFHMPPQGAFVAMALWGRWCYGSGAVYVSLLGARKGVSALYWSMTARSNGRNVTGGGCACWHGCWGAKHCDRTCRHLRILPARCFGAVHTAGCSQGHRRGRQVSPIFTETLGPTAKSIFMVGAFCVTIDSAVVFVASRGRIGADFHICLALDLLRMEKGANAGRALYRRPSPLFGFRLFSSGQTRITCCCLDKMRIIYCLFRWPTVFCIWPCANHQTSHGASFELGLLLTIWAIISFTAINLYNSWIN